MLDKPEIALGKTIGARMREARELAEFNIYDAADLLGIDPNLLKAIENCVDINNISITLIHKASNLYDVSVDFLFGGSDDWERSEDVKLQRKMGRWVYEVHQSSAAKMMNDFLQQQNKLDSLGGVVVKMLKSAMDIEGGLKRFVELNHNFDDLPASSMLVNRTNQLSKQINQCRCQLRRSKVIPIAQGACVDD